MQRAKLAIFFGLIMVVPDPAWADDWMPGSHAISYERDIAPIIREHCVGCHQPGRSAPFSFSTHQQVVLHAETIQAVIIDGYMPPWKPVPNGIHFANDRRLSEEDRQNISRWVEQLSNDELTTADQAGTQILEQHEDEPQVWALGIPDLIVRMEKPFVVPADGPDIYRSFSLPVQLPEDRWIKALELRPTARGVVHHALFFVDPEGASRTRQHPDGQPGFSGMTFLRPTPSETSSLARNFNRGLGGYVPGAIPNRLPDDLARKLPAGSDIVLQTHFHPIGKEVTEQAEMGIYFADEPPSQRLVPIQVPALFGIGVGIDIPAGAKKYVVEDSYELPVTVEAIEVGGHAHYLCESMLLRAVKPNGDSMVLLEIDDWDLNWQDQYQFANRVDLPAGTRLDVQIVYDNSASNPSNPFSPPRRVTWGRESTDEMGSLVLQVVTQSVDDHETLVRDLEGDMMASIRNRIESQTRPLRFLGGIGNARAVMMTLFDRNRDGSLQAEEIPTSRRTNLLDLFDINGDRTLTTSELDRLKTLYESLMQGSRNQR